MQGKSGITFHLITPSLFCFVFLFLFFFPPLWWPRPAERGWSPQSRGHPNTSWGTRVPASLAPWRGLALPVLNPACLQSPALSAAVHPQGLLFLRGWSFTLGGGTQHTTPGRQGATAGGACAPRPGQARVEDFSPHRTREAALPQAPPPCPSGHSSPHPLCSSGAPAPAPAWGPPRTPPAPPHPEPRPTLAATLRSCSGPLPHSRTHNGPTAWLKFKFPWPVHGLLPYLAPSSTRAPCGHVHSASIPAHAHQFHRRAQPVDSQMTK